MKGLVLCQRGIEEIVSLEVKELIGSNSELHEGYVLFDFKKKEELCKLVYQSQSMQKVLQVLDSFSFSSEKEIIDRSKSLDLKEWLSADKTFKVDIRVRDSEVHGESLKGSIGAAIISSITSYDQKVDLEAADVVVYCYIQGDKAFMGIDYSGVDLSKRSYRVFLSPKEIKSSIAYALVRLSEYKRSEVLVDPLCLSGSIAIEAALYANRFSARFFDKEFLFMRFMEYNFSSYDKKSTKDQGGVFAYDMQFKHVTAAKKNAKIAEIHKAISFSRLGVEWLDTKFKEKSVDRLVSSLPSIGKFSNKKEILKTYEEFFHQALFVLKDKGRICVCCRNPADVKEKVKEFALVSEREVWQGEEKFVLLVFKKKG